MKEKPFVAGQLK